MAKLVKLTSILTLTSYLPCLTSDLETYEREPIFILNFGQFDELNVEIDLKMAKLVKLTSNIDLDLISSVFDLRP